MTGRIELPKAALAALQRGETIEAIKVVRAEIGLGLKDAKALVDAHEAQRRQSARDSGSGAQRPAGIVASDTMGPGARWLVVIIAVAMLVYWAMR